MAMASSQQSFLISALTSTHKSSSTKINPFLENRSFLCVNHHSENTTDDISNRNKQNVNGEGNGNKLLKLAVVTLAAGVLTLGSVPDASAAKTGGRVGGQAFRPSAPRSSGPRINNSRTNIYINPPIAPPLVGGYGYGYGVPFYGGWGWSPFSFFAPGPSVAIGFGGGFQALVLFMFLGAAAAVIRRVFGSDDQDEDY